MAVTRDPRANRRRRVLRSSDPDQDRKSRERPRETGDEVQGRRRAGYSHDVRRACGQRLVGLIPVSGFAYVSVLSLSVAFPALLLLGHYMIYVRGTVPWYGHPLAVSLDASHANSLAAWFSSHLWLFCLAATVLTFQIRQHKLDDYHGEYRLWFWLVLTCLLASVDAATHISESLGLALNPWSQRTLGWTGPAIVKATMTTLIGLLGLRLCSELKSVPLSLVFWLASLFCWAGSAALAQDELRLEMTLQFRIWLKATLWLAGLTGVWLAALTYLRHVYIEAQERLIARQRKNSKSITQRLRSSFGRREREQYEEEEREPRRGWRLPGFGRRDEEEEELEEEQAPRAKRRRSKRRDEAEEETEVRPRSTRRKTTEPADDKNHRDATDEEELEPGRRRGFGLGRFFGGRGQDSEAENEIRDDQESDEESENKPRRGLMGWFGGRGGDNEDEAAEYRKVTREERERQKAEKRAEKELLREEKARQRAERKAHREAEKAEQAEGKSGGWFGWGRAADSEEESDARDNQEQESEGSGWFGRRRSRAEDGDADQPKRGFFSRFSLQPPEDNDEEDEIRPVSSSRTLPSTNEADEDEYDDDDSDRRMSRAERKRQRKRKRRAA